MEACMRVRNLTPKTQEMYKKCALLFLGYHQKAVDEINKNDVTDYLIHIRDEKQVSPSYINVYRAALKFLFHNVLGKEDMVKAWQVPRRSYNLPAVCSQSEIFILLNSVKSIVYRTIFLVMYGAGLRVGEAVMLTVDDIDSKNMIIRVRQGKGRRERVAKMCDVLLQALREYWRRTRPPKPFLFPGSKPNTHISIDAVRYILKSVAKKCQLNMKVTPHTLRHSFATHLLQSGVSIRVIQELLGHRSIRSTQVYTQVTLDHVRSVMSPLELMQATQTNKDEDDE